MTLYTASCGDVLSVWDGSVIFYNLHFLHFYTAQNGHAVE